MNSMKSTPTIRVHLNLPEESRHPPFDFHTITSLLSPTKPRLTTNISIVSNINLDRQRTARLSSLSNSYAQFLKERDFDKTKKIVSSKTEMISCLVYSFFLVITRRSSFIIIIE